MGIYSSHSYGSEWSRLNSLAKEILRKSLVAFDPEITCTGIPHIHYVDLSTGWSESADVELFRGRIEFLGKGQKINSGPFSPFPHDYVRLTIVKWGDKAHQIGQIQVGEGTELNGTSIVAYTNVSIGKNVLFAPGVVIMDSDGHPTDRRLSDTQENIQAAAVKIEDHAWIGLNAIILKGVTIGAYAVVGAGSVVFEDVPAHTIVAGNPAKVIRTLTK
jgi:carbonic anhydrase/acetyltransferase-like protein (isoleucine patch superfamily)